MPHIDDPRAEFSKSPGVGIPLLFMLLFYISNIAMVVFAVLAFFGFRGDYKNQQKLMFGTMKGEDTALSQALEENDGVYSVNYDKLGEEMQKYFNKDKLSEKKSDGKQTKQEFLVWVLEDDKVYSPISTGTAVLAVISAGLLAWLIFRSLRQIRAMY